MSQSKFALWLSRLTLLAMAVIFTSVSLRFLLAPFENAAYLGMLPSTTNPTLGITSIRVGYGIYPLGFVIVSLFSLVTSRCRPGLFFIVIMMMLLLAARITSAVGGGAMAENSFVLVGECVLLTLSTVSLILDLTSSRTWCRAG
jgi:hypothetical protein